MKNFILTVLFFFLSFEQICAQFNWEFTNGPDGGGIGSICNDEQFAYKAGLHHFFRSSDGLHWDSLSQARIFSWAATTGTLVACQFNYPQIDSIRDIRLMLSHDHGESWISMNPPQSSYLPRDDVAVTAQGIYIPNFHGGFVYFSGDEGMNWDTILSPGPKCYRVWTAADRLYTNWDSKIWRLKPNGTEWEVASPDFGPDSYPYTMFSSGSKTLIASSKYVWASTNNPDIWTKTAMKASGDFVQAGNRIYIMNGLDSLAFTENFGQNWTKVKDPRVHEIIELAVVNGKLLGNTYEKGVFTFNELTNRWDTASDGIDNSVVRDLVPDNMGRLWAISTGSVNAYDLADGKWLDIADLPIPEHYYSILEVSKSGKIAVAESYSQHFYLSKDQGISWDTIYPFPVDFVDPIVAISWLDDEIFLRGQTSGSSFISSDLGQTWTESTNFMFYIVQFKGKYFAIDPYGPRVMFTENLGQSWQSAGATFIPETLFSTPDKLFSVKSNGVKDMLYSSEDGVNWSYSGDGLSEYLVTLTVPDGEALVDFWQKDNLYYLYSEDIGLFISVDSAKTWLPLSRFRGSYEIVDSTLFYGDYYGMLKAPLPQSYGSLSSGLVFKDDNDNGIQESGEIPLPAMEVSVKEPNGWYPFWSVRTKDDGQYLIGTTPGVGDSLQIKLNSAYVQHINPPFYIINGNAVDRNFGVHFVQNISDLAISGDFSGRPRPGFETYSYLNISNLGTIPTNAIVSVKLDPKFQYVSADPAPSIVINGDSLVWNINQLPLFASHFIHILGKVESGTPVGTQIVLKGYAYSDQTDAAPLDNFFFRTEEVVSSFDPNEKRVVPEQGLTALEILSGKELFYTINFQNTGTYEAERVRITDLLDTALNSQTLRLVASSHPISDFRLLPGSLLEIVFDQIALPDSSSNEAGSHGFVTFAIQRKKHFNSHKVRNNAVIYFDFNEPVFTNTVLSSVFQPSVNIQESDEQGPVIGALRLSPNPCQELLKVELTGESLGNAELYIINMSGQICCQQACQDMSEGLILHTSTWPNGVYLLQLRGQGYLLSGKMVVMH